MLDKRIKDKLKQINAQGFEEINSDRVGKAITTMVCAIVLEGRTKIISVGDSRGYIVRSGELIKITKDESHVQKLYDKLPEKLKYRFDEDDLRFSRLSSVITNSFFEQVDNPKEGTSFEINDIYTLDNADYDKIILCSDGISDCMSTEEIAYFSKRVKGKRLADFLVQAANINKSLLLPYLRKRKKENGIKEFMLKDEIIPSKDNATAVVYENDLER